MGTVKINNIRVVRVKRDREGERACVNKFISLLILKKPCPHRPQGHLLFEFEKQKSWGHSTVHELDLPVLGKRDLRGRSCRDLCWN